MAPACFSVLMSVYDKESPIYLDRALKSNLDDQTLSPTQFVLVCDGPLNAELEAVIEKYVQKYPQTMKVCRLAENVGLGDALNYGLLQCDYELIVRADSDDVCLPGRFEQQLAYMEQHPDVAASSAAIAEFQNSPEELQREKRLPLTHPELLQFAKSRCPLNHMATIFRKSDVLEAGSYTHMPYAEDYFLWVRLLSAGKKLGNLGDILVYACIGNGMESRRGDERHIMSRIAINQFMYEHKLLSLYRYCFNLLVNRAWFVLPARLKRIVYNHVLRQEIAA